MKLIIVGTVCVALIVAALVQILRITGESANSAFDTDSGGHIRANRAVKHDQSIENSNDKHQQEPDPGSYSMPIERGHVVGQAIDAESKSPIDHFYVHVYEPDQWDIASSPTNTREYSSSLGHFTVEDFQFVEINLLVRAEGYMPKAGY